MEHRPPAFIIVRLPGLTFSMTDFQRAYPLHSNEADLKIEYIHGGSDIVRDFSLDDLDEAFRAASPPDKLTMPTQ